MLVELGNSAKMAKIKNEYFFQCFLLAIQLAHCLKISQNDAFGFFNLAFSFNFCHIIGDLSGNNV